jgi:hypothetical protein
MAVTSQFNQNPQTATINIPVNAGGANKRVECLFLGIVGGRATLEAKECLPLSTAVSIEHNDTLFLAEVVRCASSSDNGWRIEVKVEQMLTGLQNLLALRAHLLGEQPVRVEAACTPVHSYVH